MTTKSRPDQRIPAPTSHLQPAHNPHPEMVNTASPPRTSWRKRLTRGATWILIAFAALILTGLVYQSVGMALDARRYPPPGRLVDVNGHLLHIHCTGEGSPTVVLETLFGGMSSNWAWVQPEIARHTRVCTYDRPGTAWSDAAPLQHIGDGVESLHTLLINAGETAPYILVGHSLGGIYALLYTQQYPEEVAGIVLVESAHPSQYIRFPEAAASSNEFLEMAGIFEGMTRLGVTRLYFALGGQMDFGDLPPQAHSEIAARWSRPDHFTRMVSEIEMADSNYAYADRTLTGITLGDLPLAVVSGDPNQGEVFAGWYELQDELSGLSENHIHLHVPGSTHESLALHPEHAHATSQAILQVLAAARDGGPIVR